MKFASFRLKLSLLSSFWSLTTWFTAQWNRTSSSYTVKQWKTVSSCVQGEKHYCANEYHVVSVLRSVRKSSISARTGVEWLTSVDFHREKKLPEGSAAVLFEQNGCNPQVYADRKRQNKGQMSSEGQVWRSILVFCAQSNLGMRLCFVHSIYCIIKLDNVFFILSVSYFMLPKHQFKHSVTPNPNLIVNIC